MRFSLRRLVAVSRKELAHLLRDHRMRPVIVLAPIFQLVVLGYAANMDVDRVKLVVVDEDHTPVSREIAGRLGAGAAFDLLGHAPDEPAAQLALDEGRAEVAVIVPEGAARGLARGEQVAIPVWIDGTDTNRGLIAQQYVERILLDVSADHLPSGPA
ncbi:MAG: ABC transporter permease, partial [Myxococcales bacterium]|nr:ABC transporter permease [Myxococcales bacterium]